MSSDSGDYTYPAVQPFPERFPERCERRIDALEQQLAALVQRVVVMQEQQGKIIDIIDKVFQAQIDAATDKE